MHLLADEKLQHITHNAFALSLGSVLPHTGCAMPRPNSNSSDTLQKSFLIVTQTAVGCALGLLLAGKIGRPAQKTTAATLLGVGALLALPALIDVVSDAINGPGSERGERRRLDSIRTDSGLTDDADIL
jgi:hypothetical protein